MQKYLFLYCNFSPRSFVGSKLQAITKSPVKHARELSLMRPTMRKKAEGRGQSPLKAVCGCGTATITRVAHDARTNLIAPRHVSKGRVHITRWHPAQMPRIISRRDNGKLFEKKRDQI
jgi:hypothetical protein